MIEHYTNFWIPDIYKERLNIIHSFKLEKPDGKRPSVWIEHGAPDTDIIHGYKCRQTHYICMCDTTYLFLTALGYKAYYTGSIFQDLALPIDGVKKETLVYAPLHCSYVRHGQSKSLDTPVLTVDELKRLCDKYECSEFKTSVVDDTEELDPKLNLVYSDRGDYYAHFKKCRDLYSEAKMILSDERGTFCFTAESFGIPVNRDRSVHISPAGCERVRVPYDGQCQKRVLLVLEKIFRSILELHH